MTQHLSGHGAVPITHAPSDLASGFSFLLHLQGEAARRILSSMTLGAACRRPRGLPDFVCLANCDQFY